MEDFLLMNFVGPLIKVYGFENSFVDSKTRKVVQRKYKSNMVNQIFNCENVLRVLISGRCKMYFYISFELSGNLWLTLDVFIICIRALVISDVSFCVDYLFNRIFQVFPQSTSFHLLVQSDEEYFIDL